jgi:ABC-type uncharacterized transport system permease subunit
VTACLNVYLKIMQLLASILVMIALYSVNLRIMGKPNVALISEPTVFSMIRIGDLPDYWVQPVVMAVIVLIAKILLDAFFASETGLSMRATGANARMARAQGISTNRQTVWGLAISNALVALEVDFIGLKAQDLNLVTALLVGFALLIPNFKRRFGRMRGNVKLKPSGGSVVAATREGEN